MDRVPQSAHENIADRRLRQITLNIIQYIQQTFSHSGDHEADVTDPDRILLQFECPSPIPFKKILTLWKMYKPIKNITVNPTNIYLKNCKFLICFELTPADRESPTFSRNKEFEKMLSKESLPPPVKKDMIECGSITTSDMDEEVHIVLSGDDTLSLYGIRSISCIPICHLLDSCDTLSSVEFSSDREEDDLYASLSFSFSYHSSKRNRVF